MTNTDNAIWNTVNCFARPKLKYRVSLGDWDGATPEIRKKMDEWCLANNYELVIDASDLGDMNDHVRDMETRDMDKLENGDSDYTVWPQQSGGSV